jgi:hypothetical protein
MGSLRLDRARLEIHFVYPGMTLPVLILMSWKGRSGLIEKWKKVPFLRGPVHYFKMKLFKTAYATTNRGKMKERLQEYCIVHLACDRAQPMYCPTIGKTLNEIPDYHRPLFMR